MKLEIILNKNIVQPTRTAPYSLYISKTEILKSFNADQNKFIDELLLVAEMFTTPACYWSGLSDEDCISIAEQLQAKTTYKGVYLVNEYNFESDCYDLIFYIKK